MMLKLASSPVVVSALKVAGPAFFLGLQYSSVKTAVDIITNKSVGGLSLLPFASLFTNCVIWTLYGVLKRDKTVYIPNAIGILSGTFCFGAYKRFAEATDIPITIGAFLITAFAVSLYFSRNADLLGLIGCGIAVILMGSPLATLSTVIKDKSTASMPFLTSLATWCNGLSWMSYGLLIANDPMIYGPNIIGFALASIQMLLFAVYGMPNQKQGAVIKEIGLADQLHGWYKVETDIQSNRRK